MLLLLRRSSLGHKLKGAQIPSNPAYLLLFASVSAVRHSGNRCHRLSGESYDVGADLGNQIITRSVRWHSIFRSAPSSLGVR